MSRDKLDFYKDRVVVTGANGFIGSQMLRYFTEQGAAVLALVRPDRDYWRLRHMGYSWQETTYEADELTALLTQFEPTALIHAGAPSGHLLSFDDYLAATNSSSRLLHNLILASQRLATKPVWIHLCSSMIYDHCDVPLRESDPYKPINLRGLMKLHERNLLEYYAAQFAIPTRLLRVFRAYGPYDHKDRLISTVIKTLEADEPIRLNDAAVKRDFIYIDDLSILAHKLLRLEHKDYMYELNGGSGAQYAALDIAQCLAGIIGKELRLAAEPYPASPADRTCSAADTTKVSRLPGGMSFTTLEAGLQQTYAWYKANQSLWS